MFDIKTLLDTMPTTLDFETAAGRPAAWSAESGQIL